MMAIQNTGSISVVVGFDDDVRRFIDAYAEGSSAVVDGGVCDYCGTSLGKACDCVLTAGGNPAVECAHKALDFERYTGVCKMLKGPKDCGCNYRAKSRRADTPDTPQGRMAAYRAVKAGEGDGAIDWERQVLAAVNADNAAGNPPDMEAVHAAAGNPCECGYGCAEWRRGRIARGASLDAAADARIHPRLDTHVEFTPRFAAAMAAIRRGLAHSD